MRRTSRGRPRWSCSRVLVEVLPPPWTTRSVSAPRRRDRATRAWMSPPSARLAPIDDNVSVTTSMAQQADVRNRFDDRGYVVFRDVIDPGLLDEASDHVAWLMEKHP